MPMRTMPTTMHRGEGGKVPNHTTPQALHQAVLVLSGLLFGDHRTGEVERPERVAGKISTGSSPSSIDRSAAAIARTISTPSSTLEVSTVPDRTPSRNTLSSRVRGNSLLYPGKHGSFSNLS